MAKILHRIVRREELAQGTIILNEIDAPRISRKAKPANLSFFRQMRPVNASH